MYRIILLFISALFCIQGFTVFAQDLKEKDDDSGAEEYDSFEGKIIRNIIFRQIDVSGPSVDEKNGNDTSWFAKITNSLHYTTRDWVIKNYLLFKEGKELIAEEVSESERLLRESDYFLDAKIKVLPISDDSVDIRVVTKERWTLILQLSLNAQKNSYAGIKDDNLLGLGHHLDGTITHDNDAVIGWGTNIKYTAANVAGTFTDIEGTLITNKKSSIRRLQFSRPFYSTITKWAGGLGMQLSSDNWVYINGNNLTQLHFSNRVIDAWGGYSFPAWFGPSIFRKKTNLIAAGGINYSYYSQRPYTSPDSNRAFSNNTIYLLSAGIINRRYYTDHYINRFGPTEDVPVGGMLSLTWGFEDNEFSHRYYYGIEGVYSRRINNTGYFSLYAGAGGFRRVSLWEQKTYNFDILYHSILFHYGEWKLRYFLQNKYVIGTARYREEQIYLDTENGLRGYERFSLHGISSGLLKMEARIFSPFSPLGFSIGANIFSDIGIVADPGVQLFSTRIYQSYGAGLRISNESISKAHFDVAIVYRPFMPGKSTGSFAVLFTSSMTLGTRPFNFSRPSIISYGEK